MERKKAMISQPMANLSEEEILKAKVEALKVLESMGYEVVDTYFKDEWCSPEVLKKIGVVNVPLWFLSKALEKMSECDAVYFCKGWANARGCRLEHEAALRYDIRCIHEQIQDSKKTDSMVHVSMG